MRLLVEPSDYVFRNAGDMAMMHVAISRLAAFWPDASIEVLTADPDLLAVFCPGTIPLLAPPPGSPSSDYLSKRIQRITKQLLFRNAATLRRLSSLIRYLRQTQPRRRFFGQNLPKTVVDAISRADALVVTGMGGITDAFPEYAWGLLDRIETALRYGKPVAMLGQGMGPLEHPELRSKATAVLPHVGFIALREGRAGIPLLQSLGVDPDRVVVTGDDAIEIAVSAGSAQLGSGLGVNLRAATYAEVDFELVAQCREVLQGAARTFGAPIVPVPISTVSGEEDALTIQHLMSEYAGGLNCRMDVDSPLKVIGQVMLCRIVFAGSYHAAVFALSLGVPVVCFAQSNYYRDKFLGIAELFGSGCRIILAREPNWQHKLANALDEAWRTADEVKPHLLSAADRQLSLSRAAYQRVYHLVTSNTQRSRQLTQIPAEAELD
jgi:polysaccharide pyruvyl transferase WcaK-like protein